MMNVDISLNLILLSMFTALIRKNALTQFGIEASKLWGRIPINSWLLLYAWYRNFKAILAMHFPSVVVLDMVVCYPRCCLAFFLMTYSEHRQIQGMA
jgi:hypothetical protein